MHRPIDPDSTGRLRLTQAFGGNRYNEAYTTQVNGHPVAVIGHTGLDINAASGTRVYAVWPGTVYHGFEQDGFGNYLVLHAPDGREALYGHLSAFALPDGALVGPGTLIGYSGASGRATGPHLHFQVRPANPDYLNGYLGTMDPITGFDHDLIPLLNVDLIG